MKYTVVLLLILAVVNISDVLASYPTKKCRGRVVQDSLPLRKGRFIPYGRLRNEKFSATKIMLYPNPASSKVSVQGASKLIGFDMQVIRQNGKCAVSQKHWNGEAIDVSMLSDGVYILRLVNGKESYASKLVVGKDVRSK